MEAPPGGSAPDPGPDPAAIPPPTTADEAAAVDAGAGTTADAADAADADAPTAPAAAGAHPPPSPLSGGYLLIVIGEPHSAEHRDLILQRVAKGFLSWDSSDCHVDLEKELLTLSNLAPKGEESRNGERLVQYASESLVTEVLVHPQVNTLLQCVRNLLSSFTRHRHILHAGYTFAGTGSWILQDGTFSYADLNELFHEPDVQRVLRAYENSVSVDVHCCAEGPWKDASAAPQPFSRFCRVRVNPPDVLTAGSPAITGFIEYVSSFVRPAVLESLLEPSDVVGNIRFSHPTLYVFPGGQGDAALFGINGFNMLVDGGFGRKSCFWDFARHLDRLDAVLLTRLNNANAHGLASLLRRKRNAHVYPQIGHFFCNLQDRKVLTSPDGDKDRDNLLVSLVEEGQEMVLNLRHLQLKPSPCYRDSVVEPVNLYHKVGHGKLDMYVISPARDSREVKEFLARWSANDAKLFASHLKKDSRDFQFPLQNMVSVCALLVWQPANPQDNITRILFPGSTPQVKIFEGLDKIRHLEYLKHPTCTAKSLSPSSSIVGLSAKSQPKKYIPTVLDKITPGEQQKTYSRTIATSDTSKHHVLKTATIPIAGASPETKVYRATSSVSSNVISGKAYTSTKKVEKPKPESEKGEKIDKIEKSEKAEKDSMAENKNTEKQENVTSDEKSKELAKVKSKTRQASHSRERRTVKSHITEKKDGDKKEKKDEKASPTTPKKSIDGKVNGVSSRSESASRVSNRSSSKARRSPSATPAKSAKEANNRKVAAVTESKTQARSVSITRTSVAKSVKKEEANDAVSKSKTAEKQVSVKRTKPASPSKTAKVQGSPAKVQSKVVTKVERTSDVRKSRASEKDGIELKKSKGITSNDIAKEVQVLASECGVKVPVDIPENKSDQEVKTSKDDNVRDTNMANDEKSEEATDVNVSSSVIIDAPCIDAKKHEEEQRLTDGAEQDEEEEDEYLVIEKEEPYTEESFQDQISTESHAPVGMGERGLSDDDDAEDEKLKRDTQESEKVKDAPEKHRKRSEPKLTVQLTDREHAEEIARANRDEGLTMERRSSLQSAARGQEQEDLISPSNKEKIEEEVHDIIMSATEIVAKKEDGVTPVESEKEVEDIKSETKPKDPPDEEYRIIECKQISVEGREESQPDEKISTTAESGATTAPTLPEDERIPLDEIKEVVEEKHVLEETKEKECVKEDAPDVEHPGRPDHFEIKRSSVPVLHRDIIKTPDEVADLPVDEVYEPTMYNKEDHMKSLTDELASSRKGSADRVETGEELAPAVQATTAPPPQQEDASDKDQRTSEPYEDAARKSPIATEKDVQPSDSRKSSIVSGTPARATPDISPKVESRRASVTSKDDQALSPKEMGSRKSSVTPQETQPRRSSELQAEDTDRDVAPLDAGSRRSSFAPLEVDKGDDQSAIPGEKESRKNSVARIQEIEDEPVEVESSKTIASPHGTQSRKSSIATRDIEVDTVISAQSESRKGSFSNLNAEKLEDQNVPPKEVGSRKSSVTSKDVDCRRESLIPQEEEGKNEPPKDSGTRKSSIAPEESVSRKNSLGPKADDSKVVIPEDIGSRKSSIAYQEADSYRSGEATHQEQAEAVILKETGSRKLSVTTPEATSRKSSDAAPVLTQDSSPKEIESRKSSIASKDDSPKRSLTPQEAEVECKMLGAHETRKRSITSEAVNQKDRESPEEKEMKEESRENRTHLTGKVCESEFSEETEPHKTSLTPTGEKADRTETTEGKAAHQTNASPQGDSRDSVNDLDKFDCTELPTGQEHDGIQVHEELDGAPSRKEEFEDLEKDVGTCEVKTSVVEGSSVENLDKGLTSSVLDIKEKDEICVSLEELRILGHKVEDLKPPEIKRGDTKYSDIEPGELLDASALVKEPGLKPSTISIPATTGTKDDSQVLTEIAVEQNLLKDLSSAIAVVGIAEPLEAVQEDVYLESSVEEEPIFGKTDAPTHPEYVTVTPDSSPEGLKSPSGKRLSSSEKGASRKSSIVGKDAPMVQEDRSDSSPNAHTQETSTNVPVKPASPKALADEKTLEEQTQAIPQQDPAAAQHDDKPPSLSASPLPRESIDSSASCTDSSKVCTTAVQDQVTPSITSTSGTNLSPSLSPSKGSFGDEPTATEKSLSPSPTKTSQASSPTPKDDLSLSPEKSPLPGSPSESADVAAVKITSVSLMQQETDSISTRASSPSKSPHSGDSQVDVVTVEPLTPLSPSSAKLSSSPPTQTALPHKIESPTVSPLHLQGSPSSPAEKPITDLKDVKPLIEPDHAHAESHFSTTAIDADHGEKPEGSSAGTPPMSPRDVKEAAIAASTKPTATNDSSPSGSPSPSHVRADKSASEASINYSPTALHGDDIRPSSSQSVASSASSAHLTPPLSPGLLVSENADAGKSDSSDSKEQKQSMERVKEKSESITSSPTRTTDQSASSISASPEPTGSKRSSMGSSAEEMVEKRTAVEVHDRPLSRGSDKVESAEVVLTETQSLSSGHDESPRTDESGSLKELAESKKLQKEAEDSEKSSLTLTSELFDAHQSAVTHAVEVDSKTVRAALDTMDGKSVTLLDSECTKSDPGRVTELSGFGMDVSSTVDEERKSGATTPTILVTGCKTLARQSQPSESDSEIPDEDVQKRPDDVFEVLEKEEKVEMAQDAQDYQKPDSHTPSASSTVINDNLQQNWSAVSDSHTTFTESKVPDTTHASTSPPGDRSKVETLDVVREFIEVESKSQTDASVTAEASSKPDVVYEVTEGDAKLQTAISATVQPVIAAVSVQKIEAATSPMTPLDPVGKTSTATSAHDFSTDDGQKGLGSSFGSFDLKSTVQGSPKVEDQEKGTTSVDASKARGTDEQDLDEPEFTLVSKSVHEEYVNVSPGDADGDCKKLAATTTISTFTAKEGNDSPRHGEITKTVTTVTKMTTGEDGTDAMETTTTEEVQSEGKVTSHTTRTEMSPLHKRFSPDPDTSDLIKVGSAEESGATTLDQEIENTTKITDSSKILLESAVVNVVEGFASVSKNVSAGFDDAMTAGISVLSSVVGVRKDSLEAARSCTPGSDIDVEPLTPRSDMSSGQVSRAPTHISEGEYHHDSDDEPGSPTSLTSQVTHSPPPPHFDFEIGDPHRTVVLGLSGAKDDQFMPETKVVTSMARRQTIAAPMATSVYGVQAFEELEEFVEHPVELLSESATATYASPSVLQGLEDKSPPVTGDVMSTSLIGELGCGNVEFNRAVEEHRAARGSDLTRSTDTIEAGHSVTEAFVGVDKGGEVEKKEKLDQLEGTATAPTLATSSQQESATNKENTQKIGTEVVAEDPIASWGKPLGLPSPVAPPSTLTEEPVPSPKGTPQKDRLGSRKSVVDNKKRPESPRRGNRSSKISPIYIDLTYVPHHGNSYYASLEFFKRVRARYYVFSGIEPSREVYNALLEAKQSWEDKELEVTIIPTYDTDTLGYWVAENEDALAKYKIDLSPSASRCTINLQDHETSCSAYRLEF